jgi:hypothetical protein
VQNLEPNQGRGVIRRVEKEYYKKCSLFYGNKKEEVEGGWRRLHNEEFLNWYASPNIVR